MNVFVSILSAGMSRSEEEQLDSRRDEEAAALQAANAASDAAIKAAEHVRDSEQAVAACKSKLETLQLAADALSPVVVDKTGRRRTRRLTESETDQWEQAKQSVELQNSMTVQVRSSTA